MLPSMPAVPTHGPPALLLGRLRLEGPCEALLRDEWVLQRLLRRPPGARVQVLHIACLASGLLKDGAPVRCVTQPANMCHNTMYNMLESLACILFCSFARCSCAKPI